MSIQVVPEFLSHCLFQGQKLQLVRWVVPLRFTESPTRITDDSFLSILILVQNCTAANHTSITVEFKRFVVVRETQNRRLSQRFLQLFKRCFLLWAPSPPHWFTPLSCVPFPFLLFALGGAGHQIRQKLCDLGEPLYKAAIVSCEAQELSHFFRCPRSRLIHHPICKDDVPNNLTFS